MALDSGFIQWRSAILLLFDQLVDGLELVEAILVASLSLEIGPHHLAKNLNRFENSLMHLIHFIFSVSMGEK